MVNVLIGIAHAYPKDEAGTFAMLLTLCSSLLIQFYLRFVWIALRSAGIGR